MLNFRLCTLLANETSILTKGPVLLNMSASYPGLSSLLPDHCQMLLVYCNGAELKVRVLACQGAQYSPCYIYPRMFAQAMHDNWP